MSSTDLFDPQRYLNLERAVDTLASGAPTSAVIEGQTMTMPDVKTELHGYASICLALASANKAQAIARQDLANQEATMRRRHDAIKAFVVAAMGANSPTLADFGIAPKKARRALTPEQLTARAAKSRATRAARHTMGKRQKQAVTGATAPVPTPEPAPRPDMPGVSPVTPPHTPSSTG